MDNRLTHQVGSFTPNGPIYSRRYGYVPPYMRTAPHQYARRTDGRVTVRPYFGEFPYRQNFSAGYPKFVITSPGTSPNAPQYTAQDVLMLQAMRRRGLLK